MCITLSMLDPEFCDQEGKMVIMTRALHSLVTGGAALRKKLADSLCSMSYKLCYANHKLSYRSIVWVWGRLVILISTMIHKVSDGMEKFIMHVEAWKWKAEIWMASFAWHAWTMTFGHGQWVPSNASRSRDKLLTA